MAESRAMYKAEGIFTRNIAAARWILGNEAMRQHNRLPCQNLAVGGCTHDVNVGMNILHERRYRHNVGQVKLNAIQMAQLRSVVVVVCIEHDISVIARARKRCIAQLPKRCCKERVR